MGWRVWLTFGALGVIWGLPYFFIRIAVEEVPPFVVAWGRITLAALILLPIAWQRGALATLRGNWAPVCAFAVVEFVVPFSAIAVAERWIGSAIAGILIAGVPLTVVILSRFFGVHEPLGRRRLVGLVTGFLGVAALVGFGPVSGLQGWAGVACMVLATVGYAAGPLIIQRHLSAMDSLGPVAASLTIASLVLLVPALLTFPSRLPSAASLSSIAVLGVLCTAVAMLLMFYLVGHAGASRASIITYINPVVATLLGAGFLHERLGVVGTIAFGIILAGSWLATRSEVTVGDTGSQFARSPQA
ncbi:MAG TPA: EamA family transporter [Steroidobacteraceae bacterium]|nr:EamA family transporter [Steroidobacteraceae bacterium]